VTFPNDTLEELTVMAGADATPVPDKLIVGDELALLASVTVPVALPAEVGANLIESVAACPAESAAGVAIPLPVNSAPDTLTCEIFKFALPEFVIVTAWVPELPSVTFPNGTLVELTVIAGVVATPVPLSETVEGEVGALLVSEMLPGELPAVVGANVTLKLAAPPAAIMAGVARPLIV
jgi:hypothetical protein